MKLPRIMIAAPQSGTGKTMITCAILAALKKRGLSIAAFKCGPDYIDTMFHKKVLGIDSRNLDCFLMSEEGVKKSLSKNGQGKDICIIEGVMGYYDGIGGISTEASTYHLSQVTATPVILLLNCKGLSLSVAAIIKGFLEYRSDSRIVGIILNRISPMMYERMRKQLENELSIKVLGFFPEDKAFQMRSRHLGLIAPNEIEDFNTLINRLAEQAEKTVDLDSILALSAMAEEAPDFIPPAPPKTSSISIGVARDEAFSFYYEDNLDSLKELACQVKFFSPLHDKALPKGIQGLILGGGYPEIYAKALSENQEMRNSIHKAICQLQIPTIAECGGFLYLHDTLEDDKGYCYPMAEVISGCGFAAHKLLRFGYHKLTAIDKGFLPQNTTIPAHEFHYWDSNNNGESFLAEKPLTSSNWLCGHGKGNLFAGFSHIHFYSAQELLQNFVAACRQVQNQNLLLS